MKIIPNAVTRRFGRQILVLQKNSPRILFVAGITGVVASTVIACRATLKLEEVLNDAEVEISGVKDELILHPDKKRSHQKDLAYVYGKTGFRIVKLYAPAVVIGSASIAALTGSHVALTRRNASLTAAYATLSKGFDEYRGRVRHELGEEREANLYNGIVMIEGVDEKGKKTLTPMADPNHLSPYARFFDEYSIYWQKNAEHNRMFVQLQQNYLNHLLVSRGHVFLNEAYDQLGIPRSSAGQVVGWKSDGGGDCFIDFHLFDVQNTAFINGHERSILLDFNVDGIIYEDI